MKIKNELGKTYGRLKVFKYDGLRNNRARWQCICDCGKITIVSGSSLRNGTIKSCGCLKDEKTSERFKTHGLSHTLLYDVWIKIKSRCYNKNDKDYHSYGKREIIVYDKWKSDFKIFYDWAIKSGYKKGLTIERIDVNSNYEPSNCIWIKNELQALNRRNTIRYTYKNETKGIKYFSEKYNVNYYTLKSRLRVHNWPIKKAIETKSIKGRNQYGVKTLSSQRHRQG